jgi:hypothetical protein
MTTDIKICTSALYMIGAEEINSFQDETREARLCASLYGTTRDEILQSHPWLFTKQQIDLARTTTAPVMDFKYEYQIPSGTLRIFYKDTLRNDYEVFQDKIFTDDDAVTIVRQVDPGEGNYPPYFIRLLEYAMAEVLAAALAQDETASQLFMRKKNEQMRKARGIDSQNQPNKKINSGELSLTAVRGGGVWQR